MHVLPNSSYKMIVLNFHVQHCLTYAVEEASWRNIQHACKQKTQIWNWHVTD